MTCNRRLAALVLPGFVLIAACGGGGAGEPTAAGASGARPAGASAPAPATSGHDVVGMPDPAQAALLRSVPFRKLPAGHELADVEEGSGAPLDQGMSAVFTYTIRQEDGALVERTDTTVGASTLRHVGSEEIAPHLNDVLIGMKKGGVRRLRMPAATFYAAGAPPTVRPGTNVVVELRLDDVQPARPPMPFPDLSKVELSKSDSGLRWADLTVGEGTEIKEGGAALIDYTGWLENGTMFESSLEGSSPVPVENIGTAPVVEGWNEGLRGMKDGGRRLLVVPPGLGYGNEGSPPKVPPKATLIFVIEVVHVRPS